MTLPLSLLIHTVWICSLTALFCLPKSVAFSPQNSPVKRSKLPKNNDGVGHFPYDSTAYRRRFSPTRLNYVRSSDDENNNIFSHEQQSTKKQEWTMAEDWELMDQLSKFTVGEGAHCRTFWTQMAACTPILSSQSPEALFARCQYLQDKQKQKQTNYHQKEDSTSTTSSSTSSEAAPQGVVSSRPPMQFGPSPPVLSQWTIDDDSWDNKKSNNKNVMVGQLQDGRTIWLHYHCIGRLQGDPLSDSTSPSVLQLVPGGYVEAIGGRIYELGEARATKRIPQSAATLVSPLVDHLSSMDHVTATTASSSSTSSELKKGGGEKSLDWLLPPVTASVSAFLACTVLSACIGYGAGLSIIADDHHTSDAAAAASVTTRPATTTTTTSPRRESSSTPSLAEQKARAEYRILKEKRILQQTINRLEQDQKELLELQQKGI